MNETDRLAAIACYLDDVTEQFYSGHAIEHAYRPALQRLMNSFDDTVAVNDPKHSEHGAPDFVFLKKSNTKIIKGYAEAKDITVSLDKTEKTNQMERYGGYANLFLTDYLEFRFFKNGEKYQTISLGHVKDGKLYKTPENANQLASELAAFLELPPEKITRGKRLAEIMGGKARRIRDNVVQYLNEDDDKSVELLKIYNMMKKLLVHDLTEEKFADMYAQTLVYGLFVARYGDSSPETFTRTEARDLVPASNPFLRHFFDHIVGPNFDVRLGYIVDELCEVFSVSNVQEIVHKHLRIQDQTSDAKDPIIHFYEDFLQEYDPATRRSMGAYYTPIPVVKYIVRQVDKILKEEFGIAKGLASEETIDHWVETGQDHRTDKRKKLETGYNVKLPRVQVLDPAVGTATFLNETIKFIYEGFKGQEGRWPSYVNDNLVKRLHGFELMMAPYTIAHLKLGMTLKETGVERLNDRLGVYLTNTLEEGVPMQPDLFSFGLAEAVSDESRHAAEIKSNHPIMVVMGNPPYSGVSSNETKYANSLIDKYKVEPGGRQKLQERKHWLNDDYVKFMAFAEDMIEKNGSGVVAMITNNGYLDNPTFRGMRWHLAKTFDKIYVLDLHGNSKKKEATPDGGRDENVFDIMQGVGIILGVKTGKKDENELAEISHVDLYGTRKFKFDMLNNKNIEYASFGPIQRTMLFIPKNMEGEEEYQAGISLDMLFINVSNAAASAKDAINFAFTPDAIEKRMNYIIQNDGASIRSHFGLKQTDSRDWTVATAKADVVNNFTLEKIYPFTYRPFDTRYTFYSGNSRGIYSSPQKKILHHMIDDNVGLMLNRKIEEARPFTDVFVTNQMTQYHALSIKETNSFTPLYLYHDDGTRTPNFNPSELSALTDKLTTEPSPEDILDYIYAVLHSPGYREKYKEFLKTDFPRVPVPTQAEFDRLVPLGRELRQLHLMESPLLDSYDTIYPVAGADVVEKVKYEDGKVWINEQQYFGNVPETAWNFYIGGYQPAQKWLKDRKGRKLSSDDLDHYQKIIKILVETNKIIGQIDEI